MATVTAEQVIIDAPGVTVLPDRRSFIKKCVDIARSMSKKVATGAKRAGGWLKRQASWLWHLAPIKWVASKTAAAARTVWGWGRPVRAWLVKAGNWVVKSPLAWALAVAGGLAAGSPVALVLVVSGIVLVLIMLGVLIYWIRRMAKTSEVTVTTAETTVIKDEPVEETVVITEVPESHSETMVEEPNSGNAYVVKLVDTQLDPQETIEQRFTMLEERLLGAREKNDHELVGEILGRQNLLMVRAGRGDKTTKDASVSDAHKNWRKEMEKAGEQFAWTAAYRGAMAEDARLKKVRKLKAEHDALV